MSDEDYDKIIEELEERLKAATDDAKEAEAYAGELEAVLERTKAKLEKAVEALRYYAQDDDDGGWFANTTLAELSSVSCANTTGGNDD